MQTKKWHKKWKTNKGEAIKVSPLEFVEYFKLNGSHHQWEEDGILYEGEIWKCRLESREIKYLPFRVAVNPLDKDSYSKNTSLPTNPNPIQEKHPNPIVDSWEEVTLGIISKDIFPRLELLGDYINILIELETFGLYPNVIKARFRLIDCIDKKELVEAFTNYCMLNLEEKKAVSNLIYEKLYP